MTRLALIFATALALGACGSDGLMAPGGGDGGIVDLSSSAFDFDDCRGSDCPPWLFPDLANNQVPDLSTPGGPVGTKCASVCDCQSPLVCDPRVGTCQPNPFNMMLYCCDRGPCPKGQYCQPASGGFPMMCGGGPPPPPPPGVDMSVPPKGDLGTSSMCSKIYCFGDQRCQRNGCNGGCDQATHTCKP